MNRVSQLLACVALVATTSAQAQVAPKACLTGPDAEAVFLAVAPAAIKAAGLVCAPSLPRGAFLVDPDPGFIDKMAGASEVAWPRARDAVGKIAGPDLAPLLQSDAMRPMLGGLIAPLIVADLKPADCPKVDRILALLSPLPARNIAALGVTILQFAQADDARRGKKFKLPLCPTQ